MTQECGRLFIHLILQPRQTEYYDAIPGKRNPAASNHSCTDLLIQTPLISLPGQKENKALVSASQCSLFHWQTRWPGLEEQAGDLLQGLGEKYLPVGLIGRIRKETGWGLGPLGDNYTQGNK